MYSNDKKGFSILDIIVKIILFALFIFILVWLFNKKVPNMTPFYSNVFRENIKYMQEAAESYFTDDKMPTEVGGEVKMTLSEMIEKKLILPFVDKDGNSCDLYNSYVTITKQIDDSYILKTNLECGAEKDYTIKVLGCHTYCKNDCNKTCTFEKITSYQYKKQVTSTSTKYSCKEGYKLNGKYCYKDILVDTKSAEQRIVDTKTYVEDALVKTTPATKKQLETIVTTNKTYVDKIISTSKKQLETIKNTNEKLLETVKTKKETELAVVVTKGEDKTTCTTHTSTESYSCNCTTKTVNFKDVVVCSTCYRDVTTESCSTTPGATTYSCPSGTDRQTGSGSSLKCYDVTYSYSCPSGTDKQTGSGSSLKCYDVTYSYSCPTGTDEKTGSGSSLKCYDITYSYSCPTGYIKEGSGSSLKCYTVSKSYSCPAGTDEKTGSGVSLKCYDVIPGTTTYYCKDSSWKLEGTKCKKTVQEEHTELYCEAGYKLEGTLCKKYNTEKTDATAKKVTSKSWKYTWSTKTSLDGWTRTGKTKTVNGKEICE